MLPIDSRQLLDDRWLVLYPLIFGAARLTITRASATLADATKEIIDDVWDYETRGQGLEALYMWDGADERPVGIATLGQVVGVQMEIQKRSMSVPNKPKFAVGDKVRIVRKRYLNRAGQTGTVVQLRRWQRGKLTWNPWRRTYEITSVSVIQYQVDMADGKCISQQASHLDPGDGKWPGSAKLVGCHCSQSIVWIVLHAEAATRMSRDVLLELANA